MSYDAFVCFESDRQKQEVLKDLLEARVQEKIPLFITEEDEHDSLRIFVRLAYFGKGNASVSFRGVESTVEDLFTLAAVRTGRHVQHSVGLTNFNVELANTENTSARKFYE